MHLRQGMSPIDGQVHRDNLDMLIATSRCTSKDTWISIAGGFLDPTDVFEFGGGDSRMPKYAYAWDADKQNLLVCVCGMNNATQASSILFGWTSKPTVEEPSAYPYADLAAFLLSQIGRPTSGTWDSVRLIGHSYGGAIVAQMINTLSRVWANGKGYTYTYGSPKPDFREQGRLMVSPNFVRVFQDQDPVPNLPLTLAQLPGYWRLLRNAEAQVWNRFNQPNVGYSIDSVGNMSQSENPAILSTIDYFSTLTTWIAGSTAFGNSVHSLNSYRALASLIPVQTQVDSSWRSGRSHTPAVEMTAIQMNERRVQDLIVEGNNAAGAPLVAAQGIINNVPIVQGERYHGAKRGGHWCITYAGEIVSYTRTRRNTRAMVRYLNRTLVGP